MRSADERCLVLFEFVRGMETMPKLRKMSESFPGKWGREERSRQSG